MYILHLSSPLKTKLCNQQTSTKLPYIKLYENPVRLEAYMVNKYAKIFLGDQLSEFTLITKAEEISEMVFGSTLTMLIA
jgi:hypothetical protein